MWAKQVVASLRWIDTFLKSTPETLMRTWSYEAYHSDGSDLVMTLDASPWGLGGVLQLHGVIVACFSSSLTRHDQRIHRRRIGSAKGAADLGVPLLPGCSTMLAGLLGGPTPYYHYKVR